MTKNAVASRRVAGEDELPCEPLVPNDATIEAMRAARRREAEDVTLDELWATLNADR